MKTFDDKSKSARRKDKQSGRTLMGWLKQYGLCVLLFIGVIFALTGNGSESDREILESIMPTVNGNVLDAFLVPRYPSSPALKGVRTYIKSYFAKHLPSWHFESDAFTDSTPIGEMFFENLIFTQNVNAKHKIILSAHYESKYITVRGAEDKPLDFIGATDSAWPCALLLYLARMIDLHGKKRDDVSFQIVFFDGEESIRYASS